MAEQLLSPGHAASILFCGCAPLSEGWGMTERSGLSLYSAPLLLYFREAPGGPESWSISEAVVGGL